MSDIQAVDLCTTAWATSKWKIGELNMVGESLVWNYREDIEGEIFLRFMSQILKSSLSQSWHKGEFWTADSMPNAYNIISTSCVKEALIVAKMVL